MFINNFLYFYIGIMILLILFEFFWVYYSKIRDKKIKSKTRKFINEIGTQISNEKIYRRKNTKIQKKLYRELKNINNLLSYENAFDLVRAEHQENAKLYLQKNEYLFLSLVKYYEKKSNEKKAYIAYLIGKYMDEIENYKSYPQLTETLYRMLKNKNIHCRINAMESFYEMKNIEYIIRAISIINEYNLQYSNVLLAEGLKNMESEKLATELFKNFDNYNEEIQIAIIKFLTEYTYIDEDLLMEKLKKKYIPVNVRCEILRYFQKNRNEKVKQFLIEQLSSENIIANDLNMKAIGTLGYYQDDETMKLLEKIKETNDGMVKEMVYRSLEKSSIKNILDVV